MSTGPSQRHFWYLSDDKGNEQVKASYAVVLVVRVPIPDLSIVEPMCKGVLQSVKGIVLKTLPQPFFS